MRYNLVVWICVVLVECRPGVLEDGAGKAGAEEGSKFARTPQLMTDLNRVSSVNSDNLHAELIHRATENADETGDRFSDSEEDEDDPYSSYMARLVANLHQIYDGNSHNIHAQLAKRDAAETAENDGSLSEEEDSYASYMSRLVADLHRVYNAKTENLHAEINKRAAGPDDNANQEEDLYTHLMPQLMEDLHHAFNGQTANLQAEFKKRSTDDTESAKDEEGDDVYSQHLPQLMEDLHKIFSGVQTDNLQAVFNRRSSEPDKRPDGRYAMESGEHN